ncbi:hypothetical protein D3C86_2122910 [compost metagenome]
MDVCINVQTRIRSGHQLGLQHLIAGAGRHNLEQAVRRRMKGVDRDALHLEMKLCRQLGQIIEIFPFQL